MIFSDHGAEIESVYKQFDIKRPTNVIDFSTNTNVIHDKEDPQHQLRDIDFSLYPSVDNKQLIEKLIQNLLTERNVYTQKSSPTETYISSENIVFTNGTNEAIYIIASYFTQQYVAILQPTYPEYEKALLAYNCKVEYCFSIEDLFNRKYKCLFICNPNNPTGTYIKWNNLLDVIHRLNDFGITSIIDEAYIDFLYDEDEDSDKLSIICQMEHVIILRSLTKIYQLASIRIGYAISSKKWIDKLKLRQPTWSVNEIAQRMTSYYIEQPWIKSNTKTYYKKESQKIIENLRQLGFKVIQTKVNFYLIETQDDVKLIRFLLNEGIVVRHTRNHPGLDGSCIRVAIKTEEENELLVNALKKYL